MARAPSVEWSSMSSGAAIPWVAAGADIRRFCCRAGGLELLVDCGATGLLAMKRFGVDPGSIGTVALTHLDGDHAGLVFLLLEPGM